jgi:hypothetical protein
LNLILPVLPFVHAHHDLILGLFLDLLFHLMAGVGATRNASHGGHGLAPAAADLVAKQSTDNAAGNRAEAGAFALDVNLAGLPRHCRSYCSLPRMPKAKAASTR